MDDQEKWDLFNEAINLFNQQEYEKSLDIFEKALKIDPSFENAIAYKAFVFIELKSEKESLIYLMNKLINIMIINYFIMLKPQYYMN
ncbi:tetratricopeptide repeat protein [Methanobacterium alcaliphilum]|uniref:tetratricopeptide repeat protein n=1 Tax=Methanobacterium alcaliphilum TaxID=392018 RepID=UPI00200B1385|nr:tetratricopeptide repeat protein [Methanobacterium alcaliphilum]MCK9150494.1 tetratricopeptide repeat protein [Methanobacterium alcaliphilum]